MTDNRERERRFLVTDTSVVDGLVGDEIEQGYLFSESGWKARARRTLVPQTDGGLLDGVALFTLKGPKINGESPEYELRLELAHAQELIDLAPSRIVKTRYQLISEGNPWEVDVFHGANNGLVIAECEASRETLLRLRRPHWAGQEVTDDFRYNNENLAASPWSIWPENQ